MEEGEREVGEREVGGRRRKERKGEREGGRKRASERERERERACGDGGSFFLLLTELALFLFNKITTCQQLLLIPYPVPASLAASKGMSSGNRSHERCRVIRFSS